jgi:hypothetical protein
MDARAALVVVGVSALLSGCMGDDSNTGSADLGFGGRDMGAASADMNSCATLIEITPELDQSTGAPKKSAPALLTAVAQSSGGVQPSWTVLRTGDSTASIPMATDSTGLRVQFKADRPGSWIFHVSFKAGACSGSNAITLGNPTGRTVLYRFRALPSESTGLPLTDVAVPLVGGSTLTQDIALMSGTAIAGQLKSGSAGTPGEVRLIAETGPDAVAATNAQGSFNVAVQASGMYTPLLIPKAPTLAPRLGTKQLGALLATADFSVGGGATVSGGVTDPGAANITGVNAVLRAGPLPSSAARSDATGALTLHAEPGTYNLSFGSDAWPQGTLDGVVVPAGGTTLAVQYTIARVAVGGSVVASDGTTAVANARVTISSRSLGTIATVTVGGVASPASGRVSRVVSTNASGALPAMQLPAGTYDLIVEPPFGSSDGLTAVTKVVAGASTWALQLQPRLQLAGKIIGDKGQPVPNARVTAVEMVGLGAAPSSVTDAAGNYTIAGVDRGAPVTLLVEPDGAARLSGTRVPLAAGTTSADVVLAPGLLVDGKVIPPGSAAGLPAVEVDALCWSCGSVTPLATSITDKDGNFFIYLPDPGELIVDGGTD